MTRKSTLGHRTTIHAKQSGNAIYRRGLSKGLALGLILLAGFMVPTSSFLYGQESDDVLFIDESGNVGIGNTAPKASLDVKGDAIISGNVAIGLGDQKVTADNGYIKAIRFDGFGTIPIGGIIMWSGTTIPQGWRLCDGSGGRPDLRGRFVLSSGSGKGLTPRNIGERDGEENHKLTVSEIPKHSHNWLQGRDKDDHGWGNTKDHEYVKKEGNFSDLIAETGGDQPHNNMPPFYVLAFIMRVQ